jgi:hypothetical protein
MIDAKLLEDTIRQRINEVAGEQIQDLFSEPFWAEEVQNQVDSLLKQAVKKLNLELLTKEVVQEHLDQQKISPTNDDILTVALQPRIAQVIETQLSRLFVDPNWLQRVQLDMAKILEIKVKEQVLTLNLDLITRQTVNEYLTNKNAQPTDGIVGGATKVELTVMNDYVVAENTLVSKNLEVKENAEVNVLTITGALDLKGDINTENRAWKTVTKTIADIVKNDINDDMLNSVSNSVFERATSGGIDFQSVTINGNRLVDGSRLAASITDSRLTTLGELESLTVKGNASIAGSVHVRPRRLGINTEDPESALTVWDEEVCIVAGKQSKDTAYFGLSRPGSLAIGVNRTGALIIDKDGTVTAKKLKIGNNSISFSNETPGYAGGKGDIVFNYNFGVGKPWAWVCLGQFKWQEIMTP